MNEMIQALEAEFGDLCFIGTIDNGMETVPAVYVGSKVLVYQNVDGTFDVDEVFTELCGEFFATLVADLTSPEAVKIAVRQFLVKKGLPRIDEEDNVPF